MLHRFTLLLAALASSWSLAGCHAAALEVEHHLCTIDHALELGLAAVYPELAGPAPQGAFALSREAAERLVVAGHRGLALPVDAVSLGSLAVHVTPLDPTVTGLGRRAECDPCAFVSVGYAVALVGGDPEFAGRGTVALAVPLRLEDRYDEGLTLVARFDAARVDDTRLELPDRACVDVGELAGVLADHLARRYRRLYGSADLLRFGPLKVGGEAARFSGARGVLDEDGEDVLELPDGSLAGDGVTRLVVAEKNLWILLALPDGR